MAPRDHARGAVVDVVARWRTHAVAVEGLATDARAAVNAGPFLVEVVDGTVRVDGAVVDAPARIQRADACLDLAVRNRAPAAREPFDVDPDAIRAGAFGIGAVVAVLAAFHVTPSPVDDAVFASALPAGAGGAVITASFAPRAQSPSTRQAQTRALRDDGMFAPIERPDDDGKRALLGAIAELAERERAGIDDVAALVSAMSLTQAQLTSTSVGSALGDDLVRRSHDTPRPVDIGSLTEHTQYDPLPTLPDYGRGAPVVLGERRGAHIICRLPATDVVIRDSRSRDSIHDVVSRAHGAIRRCYERGLSREPTLAGKLTASWTIEPSGDVVDARVSGSTLAAPVGDGVGACIATVVAGLRFSVIDDAGIVEVNYPFVLTRGGE